MLSYVYYRSPYVGLSLTQLHDDAICQLIISQVMRNRGFSDSVGWVSSTPGHKYPVRSAVLASLGRSAVSDLSFTGLHM